MKKRIIILDHNGGRLANQLWNFMSLYAYSLEKGYTLENYSFWRYAADFNIPFPRNYFIQFILFGELIKHKWYRMIGAPDKFVRAMKYLYSEQVISDDGIHPIYLPPSNKTDPLSSQDEKTIYTIGWLFRNPVGIAKYRKEILAYFRPKDRITKKIEERIAGLRRNTDHLVGVHIRQGDYKTWAGGQYYFEQGAVRNILDEYLKFLGKSATFVLCSDENIDVDAFKGLNIQVSNGSPVEDLFLLSKTDAIIGSNSTFGAFASYYGNIPYIVFNENIDWEYYRDKREYFENKYSTLVHY
ncbi:MAG: alpha-1,2-fucosyltransferase [Patescibacteria group bacterium]